MMLGIIGGVVAQFAPLMDLYRSAGLEARIDPAQLKTGVTSYLHIEKTSQQAIDEFYPYHTHYFDQLGRSRGRHMQLPRGDYERAASLEGAYLGGLPYTKVAQTIELLATEVAPVVRRETTGPAVVRSN